MPLPILQGSTEPTPDNLVRLFHRTELHWVRHVGEEAQLDAGTAFTNPDLPNVPSANGMFDATVPEGSTVDAVVEEVESHYASKGTRCLRWVLNPSAQPSCTRPLAEHLLARGYRTDQLDILHLTTRPAAAIREASDLTIIPARASFRHTRALADEAFARRNDPRWAEAEMLHLDDPHWDALLALRDGEAVAHAGVLAVGEIGRIDQVYVGEAFRRQGIGRTMMGRALEICARSMFRHVMICVNPANAPAIALYGQLGFRKVGEMVIYRSAG